MTDSKSLYPQQTAIQEEEVSWQCHAADETTDREVLVESRLTTGGSCCTPTTSCSTHASRHAHVADEITDEITDREISQESRLIADGLPM